MVTIISKSDGPRREDEAARRMISQNRATIEKIADHLSNGRFSAQRAAPARPQQEEPESRRLIGLGAGSAAPAPPKPYLRISPTGRVVVVDYETSRQMHHLGEIRRIDGQATFLLATGENGFPAPLDAALGAALADLDRRVLDAEFDEEALSTELGRRLDLP